MGHEVIVGSSMNNFHIRHLSGSPFARRPANLTSEEALCGRSCWNGAAYFMPVTTHLSSHRQQYLAEKLGATIRSIALIPRTPEKAREAIDLGKKLATEVNLAVYTGQQGSPYQASVLTGVSVGGGADIIVPLILGGMIIFSTMLGSVAERGKEIFIYASLGLAPLHIAALFLVEASIYAVIGGMGGYILAQSVGALLSLMAEIGWLASRPDINYSSFTAVITILIVMATILISALYPAWMASQSAKPGEDSDVDVPEPVDDRIEIPFVHRGGTRDIRGLLACLTAYFDSNTESSAALCRRRQYGNS